VLSLSHHRDADAATVVARGDIDLSTVDELVNEIAAATAAGVKAVVVDLSEVAFVDSAGISALLRGRRLADEHAAQFRVTGAAGLVREVLEMTGVWQHLSGQTVDTP
jgi:anti-sigma B factor antagonist